MPFESSKPQARGSEALRGMAQVYEIGRQRVIQGDCLRRLRGMPDATFDLIITSPPYNIGIAYRTYNDSRSRCDYLHWFAEVGTELKRVLKDDGSFFLNVGSTNADAWISMDVAAAFRSLFRLQNWIVWVKSIAIGENTVGHFKPINSPRYLNHGHEMIFQFTKSGDVTVDRLAVGVPFKDKTNIARWGHLHDKRCAGNVWFMPYATSQSRQDKFNHPAGFPLALPKRCMQLHGRPGATVLDPFLGAGTTLVAAEELGLRGVGIEIDKHYVDVAIERIRELAAAI